MKTKEEISEYLQECLMVVYCDNCRHDLYSYTCDECDRKNTNWGLSKKAADEMAKDILGE